MAAGMGSRYGGLKQIDPIDGSGHIIMDYSIYDALAAGFGKVIFVIKKENKDEENNEEESHEEETHSEEQVSSEEEPSWTEPEPSSSEEEQSSSEPEPTSSEEEPSWYEPEPVSEQEPSSVAESYLEEPSYQDTTQE